MALQSLLYEGFLLFCGHIVQNGLDCVRALFVAANFDEVFFNQVQNVKPLLNRAIGKQLLKEVVAILITHYWGELLTNLREQKLNQLRIRLG